MHETDMTGKVIVVTGSARGLGAHIATTLANYGATVVIHYKSSIKQAKAVLNTIQAKSPRSFMIKADLTQKDQVAGMFTAITKSVGSVDVLVNTIGNFLYEPIEKTSFETFRDVVETNLYATFLCCHAVLPAMKKRKKGSIINFGSVGCDRILLRPNTTPYYMAKTGVYMLTKILADSYAQYGVRINMISPGPLPTSTFPKKMPRHNRISFDDIMHAIYFLLSKNSSHIIGTNIDVTAGWTPELAASS